MLELLVAVTVIAIARLEVLEIAGGIGQRVRIARTRTERHAHGVRARKSAHVVHREVGEERQEVVLDLAEADQPLLVAVM